jgi:hypothetical protein
MLVFGWLILTNVLSVNGNEHDGHLYCKWSHRTTRGKILLIKLAFILGWMYPEKDKLCPFSILHGVPQREMSLKYLM